MKLLLWNIWNCYFIYLQLVISMRYVLKYMKLLPWNIFQCGVASCETNFCENIWNYFSKIYETATCHICNLLFQWDMYWNVWNYFPEIYVITFLKYRNIYIAYTAQLHIGMWNLYYNIVKLDYFRPWKCYILLKMNALFFERVEMIFQLGMNWNSYV